MFLLVLCRCRLFLFSFSLFPDSCFLVFFSFFFSTICLLATVFGTVLGGSQHTLLGFGGGGRGLGKGGYHRRFNNQREEGKEYLENGSHWGCTNYSRTTLPKHVATFLGIFFVLTRSFLLSSPCSTKGEREGSSSDLRSERFYFTSEPQCLKARSETNLIHPTGTKHNTRFSSPLP